MSNEFPNLKINDLAPDFTADSSMGKIHLYEFIGDAYVVLFSHPKDFTPVCTTELAALGRLEPEFKKRHVKILGLSVDTTQEHARWLPDIEEVGGCKINYPIIADTDLTIAKLYNMLPASLTGGSDGRTPADNQAVRSVFIIGPDKRIKLILTYPMTTGRNFKEILRTIDSLQLTQKHKVATPADWQQGDDVIIAGSVNNDDAKKLFPDGWQTIKPYLRKVKDPSLSS